ncbi:MAG TPA: hypothetical protein VGR35_01790 [Tepidisphaeraceae bacterium]|nr:hypothetical protein [Tepidisphaeraceae bacterium]
MLYVYKQSAEPIQPWSMLHVGGKNNIAPQAKVRFLVLDNVDVIHRDGAWHYLFAFDTRNSLELSPLAQLMQRNPKAHKYADSANWKAWLGDGWQVIDEHVRWEILHMPGPEAKNGASITDLRILDSLPDEAQVPNRLVSNGRRSYLLDSVEGSNGHQLMLLTE